MGITNDISTILREVKKLPGLPGDVYKKLKTRLDELEAQIARIDLKKFGTSVLAEVRTIVTDALAGVTIALETKLDETRGYVSDSIEAVKRDVAIKFEGVEGLVGQIPVYFQQAVDKVQENLVSPITGFIRRYFIPLIVGAIVVVLSPVLFPLIGLLI